MSTQSCSQPISYQPNLNPKPRQQKCPIAAVFADCQNVHIWKTSPLIVNLALGLGKVVQWSAYEHWRTVPLDLERQIQKQGWRCIDVADRTKNAADHLIKADIRNCVDSHRPDFLVLVTNDGGFAPLVKELLEQGIHVIVIGRRNCMSQRFFRHLSPEDIVYIEDLQQLPLAS